MAARSDSKRALAELRRGYLRLKSVLFDRVTGLPVFAALTDRLRTLLDERRALGVIHIEIEQLELVESLYGWQVFDRIVTRAADALKGSAETVLPAGTLLATSGLAGDRFAAFVPNGATGEEITREELERFAVQIRERLDLAFADAEFAGLAQRVKFREGWSLLSLNPFYRFERRLHAALEEARGLHERRASHNRRGMDDELQRILREPGLRTVFQPVVDLQTRRRMGWEALARGPEHSVYEMPAVLFSASQRLGLDADLDRLCRESALRSCSALATSEKIFLNVLPSCFDGEPLHGLVDDPHDFVLEFSERGGDGDPAAFAAAFSAAKSAGFDVALDDVGTGYASQAVLERVRPDYLKLDVSLVREIDRNFIKQELLHSLIRIANRMGASVIAEGVETEDEAGALLAAGATYGQGCLFARPTPAATASDRCEPEGGA